MYCEYQCQGLSTGKRVGGKLRGLTGKDSDGAFQLVQGINLVSGTAGEARFSPSSHVPLFHPPPHPQNLEPWTSHTPTPSTLEWIPLLPHSRGNSRIYHQIPHSWNSHLV